jgi:long-chain acyl-CoA synthetase
MSDEAVLQQRPPSVGAMFVEQVAASGDREAFRYVDGERWVSLSWTETRDQAFELAAGLLSLGLGLEDRVAIASSTRIEWILADLAIMCAGGATTTIYPTTKSEDLAYILANSGAKIVFAEDDAQVAKILEHPDAAPALTTIVQIAGRTDSERVMSWSDFRARGRDHLDQHPGAVEAAIATTGPDHLATLVYTSGTTGRPKGVRLVHDSWTYEGTAVEAYDIIYPDDLQYLWLPLSHVFGKALIAMQLKVGFASAVDGRVDKIVENLGVVRPTFMAGAPRIFEKVRSRIMGTATSGVKAKIFAWAFAVGRKTTPTRLAGRKPTGLIGLQFALADRLVFSKIKARMGGRIRFFVSGSAALNREVQEWFYAADLLVLEGYGLTETTACSCVNNPRATRFGTVGPALPGTEVKLAEDGEILIKSPGVMRGYHVTGSGGGAAVLEDPLQDGWLATGDIGILDPQGYLRITDRKKDLIKTSGGKYVAPQKVEGILKAAGPYISQVIIHGEGRKYVTALLTLDGDDIAAWAKEQGVNTAGQPLVSAPEVRTLVEGYIAQANRQLERWETIKNFTILPTELSIEEGEITPSMKVRRRTVEAKYRDLLDTMYAGD